MKLTEEENLELNFRTMMATAGTVMAIRETVRTTTRTVMASHATVAATTESV
ncbi:MULTISPECIES: hypothetical protein [Sporosarcina]|jgi:hypothetical protein|uniref:Uncharacterized protein n=1 Tax=Sporosarcina psychrophila TaxID=1476 RepID=A0ABV2KCF2_SPOPS|nr:hypothetical protein [Sporosarcina psychrophila]